MKARTKGVLAILTGGGDVPGLNPAIRAVTVRAYHEGWQVLGIKGGWEGLIQIQRDRPLSQQSHILLIDETNINRLGRTGGTFLHCSRTNPSKVKKDKLPEHLKGQFNQEVNDLTSEVLKNLDYLGIDCLIPIGGDDTLSYACRLDSESVPIVAIPKTMDNDVPGTDYCIGFSTCVTRTLELTHQLRTCAGSHERFLVIEVFGRYAGFTALMPTMAGAAERCVIPEYRFNIERLSDLLIEDREKNPSRYSVVLVSEGAMFEGGEMIFTEAEQDAYGHKKLGGIGDLVSDQLKRISRQRGHDIEVINQRLSYLVRSGHPDAIDSVVPMAFGNLALNLIGEQRFGQMVNLSQGRYGHCPVQAVIRSKKQVDVANFYDIERYCPIYKNFEDRPLWIMTSDHN